MTIVQLQPLGFDDVKVGDTLRFLTNDNGFNGRGIYSRTGKVTGVTDKSVTVACDDKSTARLTKATWHYREPQKVTDAPKTPPAGATVHYEFVIAAKVRVGDQIYLPRKTRVLGTVTRKSMWGGQVWLAVDHGRMVDYESKEKLAVIDGFSAARTAPQPVRPPHQTSVIRFIKTELGLPTANLPQHGGFIVSQTSWDNEPVLFVGWAYEQDNMRERGLTDEVRKIAETLKKRGYLVHSLRKERNFFFVVPEKFKDIADR